MNLPRLRFAPLLLLVSSAALAGEKPVAKDKVPKAVLQTVTTSYPKGKILETVIETEDNRKLYEVRVSNGTVRVDLKIEPAGKLVAEEHLMDAQLVPSAVSNAALAPPYQDWKVTTVEKVENLETPAESGYEVLIVKDGKKREVLLTGEGKLLKIEEPDDVK